MTRVIDYTRDFIVWLYYGGEADHWWDWPARIFVHIPLLILFIYAVEGLTEGLAWILIQIFEGEVSG